MYNRIPTPHPPQAVLVVTRSHSRKNDTQSFSNTLMPLRYPSPAGEGNKKPVPKYGNGKKHLYHPFTYPPICAQDYGRAPSFITRRAFHECDSEVIFTAERGILPAQDHGKTVSAYSVSGLHHPRLSVTFQRGYCLRQRL